MIHSHPLIALAWMSKIARSLLFALTPTMGPTAPACTTGGCDVVYQFWAQSIAVPFHTKLRWPSQILIPSRSLDDSLTQAELCVSSRLGLAVGYWP